MARSVATAARLAYIAEWTRTGRAVYGVLGLCAMGLCLLAVFLAGCSAPCGTPVYRRPACAEVGPRPDHASPSQNLGDKDQCGAAPSRPAVADAAHPPAQPSLPGETRGQPVTSPCEEGDECEGGVCRPPPPRFSPPEPLTGDLSSPRPVDVSEPPNAGLPKWCETAGHAARSSPPEHGWRWYAGMAVLAVVAAVVVVKVIWLAMDGIARRRRAPSPPVVD